MSSNYHTFITYSYSHSIIAYFHNPRNPNTNCIFVRLGLSLRISVTTRHINILLIPSSSMDQTKTIHVSNFFISSQMTNFIFLSFFHKNRYKIPTKGPTNNLKTLMNSNTYVADTKEQTWIDFGQYFTKSLFCGVRTGGT